MSVAFGMVSGVTKDLLIAGSCQSWLVGVGFAEQVTATARTTAAISRFCVHDIGFLIFSTNAYLHLLLQYCRVVEPNFVRPDV